MRKQLLSLAIMLIALFAGYQFVGAQTVYKLTQNFDATSSGIPANWDNSEGSTTYASYKWTASSPGYGGSGYCLRFDSYSNSNGNDNFLKTPSMDLSTGAWVLKFKYKNPTGGDFSVFISTDGGATYTTSLFTGLTGQSNWTPMETSITTAAAGSSNVKIIFKGTSNYGNGDAYIYLDDVTVESAPDCKSVDGLVANGLTLNGATLKWGLTADGAVPATYIYSLVDANGTTIESNPALTATFDGTNYVYTILTQLTPNTTYTASLQGDCTSGSLGYSNVATVTFTTLAPAQNLPFFEHFDSLTVLPTSYYLNNASLNTQQSYSHSANNSVKLTTTAANGAYIIFPAVNATADNMEIDYYIRRSSSSSTTVTYYAGYLTDPSDVENTFVPVLIDSLPKDATWHNKRFNTAAVGDQTTPVMFCISIGAGVSASAFIDDVDIHTIPTCIRPENLVVTDFGADNVTLDWDVTNANNVRIYATNTDDASVITALASQHPYTMTGLSPQTTYEFRVRGICSGNDSSEISTPVSVRTRCAIATSTLFFEGAESTSGTALPECWEAAYMNSVSSSTAKPFQTQTSTKQGTRGFQYNYTTSGSISYLCSQQLNFDQSGKYTFRYKMSRRSGSLYNGEGLKIFVTPTIGDTTNAVQVIPFVNHYAGNSPAGTSGWNEYEGIINYQGVGYIMIVGYTKGGYSLYFDDLEVFLTPTCPKVSNLSVGNATQNSADVTWNVGLNETQWIVDYSIMQGMTPVKDTTEIISGQPQLTISGLTAATSYNYSVSVRAYCGGTDTAEAVTATGTFTTQCDIISVLPYEQNFETLTTGQTPLCWSILGSTATEATSNPSYVWGVYEYNGNKMIRMYNFYVHSGIALITLPEIQLPTQPAELLFSYSNRANCGDLLVKIKAVTDTAYTDLANYGTTAGTDATNPGTFVNQTISLANYAGQNVNIQFYSTPNYQSGALFIDNVIVREQPSCLDIVGNIAITDKTDTSITFTMQDTTATNWQYAYGVTGTPVAQMTPVSRTGSNCIITGLTAATSYDIYVRRDCGSGDFGAWSAVTTVVTIATPAQMPYVCGFEDAQENASWMYADGAGVNVFTVGTAESAVYAGTNAMYVTTNRTTALHSYNTSDATKSFAYRTIHFDAKGYQFEIKFKSTGGESGYDFGRIFLSPASATIPSGEVGTSLSSTTFPTIAVDLDDEYRSSATANPQLNTATKTKGTYDADGWHTISYFLDMTNRPGNYNLVLMWNDDTSAGTANYPLAVDNINIYELTCIPPATVVVSNLSSSAADITIQQTEASQWEVLVDDAPFTKETLPDSAVYRAVVNNSTVNLTDLTQNTIYYYAVRTVCGQNDTSDWNTVAQFHTYCSTVELPLQEGFETVTSTDCWSNLGTTGSISRNTSYKKTGAASMKISDAQVVSPQFDVITLASDMINGHCYSTTDSASFAVGVMTDPNDVSSYIDLTTVMIPVKNTWTEFTSYFSLLLDPDYADWYNAQYIVLAPTAGQTIYFDDFIIDEIPTCPKPTETSITNVTANSFDISFTDNTTGTAEEWIVTLNDIPQTITSTQATITGLAAHTQYEVKVAAKCSASDTSYYTNCGKIMTECDALSTPYTCGFETTDGFTAATTYTEGVLEANCWSTLNMSTSYPSYMITNSTYLHDGTQGLRGNSSPSKFGYWILPIFKDPTDSLNMEFWYKNEGTGSNVPYIEVGYMTDATVDSSFVLLQRLNKTQTMTKVEQSFIGIGVPSNARIAFRFGDGSSQNYWCGIDDIMVKRIRSCSDPNTPTVSNITSSSAVVSFTDTCAAHNAWEYVYGRPGFDPSTGTPVAVDASRTFTLTGLTDDATYTVYVRANCGSDYSNWIPASFSTLCNPFAVTYANPFSESFSDFGFGEYIVNGSPCYTVEGQPSSKSYWAQVYPTNDQSTTSYKYCYGNSTDPADKCLYWYMYKSTVSDGSILRQFHLQADSVYEIAAYVRSSSSSSYSSTFKTLMGTSLTSLDTLAAKTVNGASVSAEEIGTEYWYFYNELYQPFKTIVSVDSTGDYYIGFNIGAGNSSSYIYSYLDDWTIRAYSGCAPKLANVSDVTSTSAHVTMSAPAYQFEYVLNDTTQETTITDSVEFNLNGLNSASAYTLYVRTYCDATSYSEWFTVQFATACGVITAFPYVQDFESYTPGSQPNCWDISKSTTSTVSGSAYYVWGVYQSNNNKSIYMCDYWVNNGTAVIETPVFQLPAQPVELSFDYAHSATYCTDFTVGISTNGGSTYTSLGTFDYNDPAGTYSAPGTFQHVVVDLTNYVGQSVMFNLNSTAHYMSGAIYVDNFNISFIPACREPQTAPTVDASTMTTLSAHASMATKDTIEFGIAPYSASVTSADIDTTVISTDGYCTFTGLTGATQYAVWYRYYCGEEGVSDWSKAYSRGTTTSSDCFEPQNLRTVGFVNDHHAAFTWGVAPSVTRYDYELYQGTSAAGTLINSGSTTGADTIVYDSLAGVTNYYFRVIGYCTGDTTAWSGLSIKTTYPTMTVPFICNFEDPLVNVAWNFTNNVGNNQFVIGSDGSAQQGGSQSLYVSDNSSTYQYTTSSTSVSGAEVLLELAAGNYLVQYDWNCYGESSYDYGRMFLAASNYVLTGTAYGAYSTLPSDAISLDNNARLNTKSDWQQYSKIINVPTDGVYKLMVTWCNDPSAGTQPPLAIDNLSIQEVLCMPLTSVTNLSLTSNRAKYILTRYEAGLDIQYGYSTVDSQDSITWITRQGSGMNDTIVLNGLSANTTYYLFAREICDSVNVSPATRVVFTTPNAAQSTPFICGFESGEATTGAWLFAGNNNEFIIGGGTSSQGSASMYVSDDGNSWNYSVNSASNSYAYVPLEFAGGTYDIEYEWTGTAESGYDYARVYLAPASFVPTAGVQVSGIGTTGTPAGWIALDGNAQLNQKATWQTKSLEHTFADSTVMNLVVYWRNDGSVGNQPPFAIDNISITKQLCTSMVADSFDIDTIGLDMFTIKYYNPTAGASTQYIVSSNAQYSDTVAMGVCPDSVRSFTVTGLEPSTKYYCAVRSVCGVDTLSKASKFSLRTNCATLTVFPYHEGFENMSPVNTVYTGTSNQFTDACWTTTAMSYNDGVYALPVDATGSAAAIHTGSQGMYLFNSYDDETAQTLALPEMDSLNGKTISFWHYGANSPYYTCVTLDLGYINANGGFTTISTTSHNGAWEEFTTTLSNIPAGVKRLAFRFTGALAYYLDDIHINTVVTSDTLYEAVCNNEDYTGHGLNIPSAQMTVGNNLFTQTVQAITPGESDTTFIINVFKRPAITHASYDTICAGQPYQKGIWNITNPTSRRYYQNHPGAAACGCDSTDELYLTVISTYNTVADTICQGDSYQFHGQTFTQTGTYTVVDINRWGCTDTTVLNLVAVDSVTTVTASTCAGVPYVFHGQSFTQSGTYHVTTYGARGCETDNILYLTVTTTDSICNVSFCKGGSIIIGDTTITTPGSYVVVRPAGTSGGCDITYYITATETPVTPEHTNDYACEGKPYYGYGIMGDIITKDTTYTFNRKTLDGKCDSISYVHLTYVATKHTYESAQIVQGDVYKWQGRDLTDEGDYTETLPSHEGCDSIVHLHLSYKGQSVENVANVNISIVPNPVTAGQTSFVYGNFTDVKNVEVLNSFGQVIDTFVPESYPIEVSGINAAGIYFVRVTTTDDKVAIQKLIVK